MEHQVVRKAKLIQVKQEHDVSLGLWNKWLYKLLLYRFDSSLAFGLAELGCGRNAQRTHNAEQIGYYVLSGQGAFERSEHRQLFKPSDRFLIASDTAHDFDCDTPTRLFVVSGPSTLDLNLTPEELKPDQSIQGWGQCHYMLNGRVKLIANGETQTLPVGTAFYVAAN